jgi:hypothetical protein
MGDVNNFRSGGERLSLSVLIGFSCIYVRSTWNVVADRLGGKREEFG